MEDETKYYIEEKEPGVYRLVRLATTIVAVYGAVIAVKKFVERLSKKFEEENRKGGVKRHLLCLDGKQVVVEGKVGDLELYSAMSGGIIDLTKATFTGENSLTIYGFMSGLSIKVPAMVRVENEALELIGGYADLVPSYEDNTLPVLKLKGVDVMCGKEVKIGHKEK